MKYLSAVGGWLVVAGHWTSFFCKIFPFRSDISTAGDWGPDNKWKDYVELNLYFSDPIF